MDFIEVKAWNKLAEICTSNLTKGRLVAVTGRLQIRKNTTGDRTYINPEVIAGEVKFLDWAKNKEQSQSQFNGALTEENQSNQASTGQNQSSQNPDYNSYNNGVQTEEDMEIDVPF